MNNLSKLGNQLLEIWKQLGASQRISVIAATVVLVAGLGMIAFWSSSTNYSLLYGKLSDTEASKVITALDDAKVSYKITEGGSAIMVPADKVYSLRMQLAGKGIPSGDGVGFEILDKPNFGISDFVQRADYIRAVDGELARTISQIDGVDAARVMIVLPENRLLLDQDQHPTASVFVRVTGNTQLPPSAVNAIQFLVANSVEGLAANNVAVVDNLGNVLSADNDDNSIAGLSSSQLAAQRDLEQYLSKKAQDMLEKVLGPGQAIVRVSAEINFDTLTTTQDKYDPDGQVVQTQTKDDETTSTSTSGSTSAVGITANISTDTNATKVAAAPVNNSDTHKTSSTMQYEIGRTTSNMTEQAGGIKRLTAAVTIAEQYDGTGADRKPVIRTPEELAQLKQIVTDALGADTTRGDSVTLEELPFNNEFAATVTQQLDQQQRRQFWWETARNLVYPAFGLGALFLMFRIFKRTPVQEIPLGVPVGRILGTTNGNGNGHSNGNGNGHGHWMQEQPRGVVTVDVLNRLIKENPANMSQAIRDWMNRGTTPER